MATKTRDQLVKEAADLEATVLRLTAHAASLIQEHANVVTNLKAEHDKKLGEANNTKTMWYNKSEKLEAEVDMVHLVLDTLPGAPPRELKSSPDAYSSTRLTLVARLAGYLAIRS